MHLAYTKTIEGSSPSWPTSNNKNVLRATEDIFLALPKKKTPRFQREA